MMQVVAEIDEPFVPVPDELIVNLRESREAVEALLDNLANSFAATTSVSLLRLLHLCCAFVPTFLRCKHLAKICELPRELNPVTN